MLLRIAPVAALRFRAAFGFVAGIRSKGTANVFAKGNVLENRWYIMRKITSY